MKRSQSMETPAFLGNMNGSFSMIARHDSASANRVSSPSAHQGLYGRNPDPLAVGGFDGSISFTRTLKKTGGGDGWRAPHLCGQGDGMAKAALGQSSIDPAEGKPEIWSDRLYPTR